MRPYDKRLRDEEGAAILELVMITPVLVIFAAGILDLSLYIKCNMTVDSASTALARRCMDDPSLAKSNAELCSYLSIVEPTLTDAEVTVETKDAVCENYTYNVYPDNAGGHVTRNSSNSYTPFTVTVSYAGSFFTPIGRGISLAAGGDGSLTVMHSQTGRLDTTSGATW